MKKYKYIPLLLVSIGFSVNIAHADPVKDALINTYETAIYSLKDLTADNIRRIQKSNGEDGISNLRADAIKSIALQLGVSSGLSHQMQIYSKTLQEKSAELDMQYNFEMLKLSPGVLPPVLSQGFGNYEKQSDDVVMISDKNFKIEQPARMVSTYPTWRDYLQLNLKPAPLPQANFMPKTSAEKRLWDNEVKRGWEIGVRQAGQIWEESFAKLNRDYQGMILYKQLLAQGAITPAVVATANLGVTGNGTEMSVNHRVVRITNQAEFNTNSKTWRNQNPATYKAVDGKIF